MNLNLYDENLNRIAIIGNQFVSALWAEGYNTVESGCVEVRNTDDFRKKIKPNCYIGRTDRDTLMIIKTVEVSSNSIVAHGEMASRILDDVAYIGTINTGVDIPSAIRDAYNSTNGFPNYAISNDSISQESTVQISNQSLLEMCLTLCQTADLGFRSVKKNGQIELEFYKPTEQKTVFREEYGNMALKDIVLSTENYKNYAIVLGEGEGEERARVDVDLTNGGQRYDLVVDARDIQMESGETTDDYRERLRSRGVKKLREQQKTWNCEIEPNGEAFGVKYELGDKVLVLLPKYNLRLEARISKFEQKEQNNQTTTTVTVGQLTIMR